MKNIYLLVLILLVTVANNPILRAQNPEWQVYTNGNVTCLADEGSDLWIGTAGGLVKLDKSTGTTTFYNTTNSGLTNLHINSITIDSSGNKWFGTDGGGLVKFDGTTWSVYNSSNSKLSTNFIGCIAVDSKNNIWMGVSHTGLVKFDGINWEVFNTSNSELPANSISSLTIDGEDNLWFTCYTTFRAENTVVINGFGLIKFDNENWVIYDTTNSEISSNYIQSLVIDCNDNKWIGTNEGLARFDNNNWTVYDTSNSELPGNDVICLAADKSDKIWIDITGVDNNQMYPSIINYGLGVFDGNNLTIYDTSNSGMPNNNVSCLFIDGDDNKWIGTSDSKLIKFDGTNWTEFGTSNSGLPDNNLRCIYIDNYDNKWIGTYNGFTKFYGEKWTSFPNHNLHSNPINCISADRDGNKWIGTWNGLIKFDDNNNWTEYDTSNSSLPDNFIHCIAVEENNCKWIGTRSGLVKINGTDWTVYNSSNSDLPLYNSIECITIDNNNNKWIGATEKLLEFDGTNWTTINIPTSKWAFIFIRSLVIDNNDSKWIGMIDSGFAKFDGTNWTLFNNKNSGLPSPFTCLAIDNENNKWIGTTSGLAKFDNSNWTVYTTSNSDLPENYISSIAIDKNGNKWIATSYGLAVFNEGGIITSEKLDNHKIDFPDKFYLSQNYPNPFNPSTTIKYSIPKQSYITLKVYDILGKEVATLVNEEKRTGNYEVKFSTVSGIRNLASGIYFYQIKASDYVSTKKMILLK